MARRTELPDRQRAYVDIETSGLDPAVHEMLEFAVVYDDRPSFTCKIAPRRIEKADPKALEVNGYQQEGWTVALDPLAAASHIEAALKDCVLVGHNINKFDMPFIQAFMKEVTGKEAKIGFHTVDTLSLSYEHLAPCGIKSIALKNVCLFLGLEPEPEIHSALNGARCCQAVYHKLARAGVLKRLWWKFRSCRTALSAACQ